MKKSNNRIDGPTARRCDFIYDYLIIGQGIAGTVLAFTLMKAGKKILVIDRPHPRTASRVAAGVINPVTGRRLLKSWKLDELLPFAFHFYDELEKLLEIPLLQKQNILRVFENVQEQNDFLSKSGEEAYQAYLKELEDLSLLNPLKHNWGAGEICPAAYLNVSTFLDASQKWLKAQNAYLNTFIEHEKIHFEPELLRIDGAMKLQAKRIIFCEGVQMRHNPFFNYLPIKPSKGSFLVIKAPDLARNKMIKKRVMIVPWKESPYFWVGSTYDHDDLSEFPSEEGIKELKQKLDSVLKVDYELVETGSGIRPTVRDRRPLIGQHPNYPQLFIFNGMGSKGVSLAPFFAQEFLLYLEGQGELDREVNLKKWSKKFKFEGLG